MRARKCVLSRIEIRQTCDRQLSRWMPPSGRALSATGERTRSLKNGFFQFPIVRGEVSELHRWAKRRACIRFYCLVACIARSIISALSFTMLGRIRCSSRTLRSLSTKANPCAESIAADTILSPEPVNPACSIRTIVFFRDSATKFHSVIVRSDHCTRMRLSGSRTSTFTRSLTPCTLKSHRTVFPCSSDALALDSQNFFRFFGFVKAAKTECIDDLINCSMRTMGARL
jgi:hypothetical protein